jgi:LCP family protein required for cell wall assembly
VLAAVYIIAPPPRMNILLLGLDARSAEETATRTDTIILATVDPDEPYAGMLSIPRDLYLEVPGYGPNRINAAHVFGELEEPGQGIELAAATIEQSFGVEVHRYVRVNFEGFVAIVDAAGGLTIDVESYFIDYEYPTPDFGTIVIEFQPGRQVMDGERALQYARSRHGTSDLDRAQRQQQVVAALFRRLLSPAGLLRLPAVYRAFAQHVDTNLTLIDAVALAPAVIWVGPDGIDRRVFTDDMFTFSTTANGGSVLAPEWDAIGRVVEEMFGED